MADAHRLKASREIFLAAFGAAEGGIEPWVLDRVTALLEEEDAVAADVLYKVGDPADRFLFLRRGRVSLVGPGTATETVVGPTVVGMFDVFLDRPRNRTAVALDVPELMSVRTDAWLELLEDSFDLARASVVGMARHLSSLEDQVLSRGASPWLAPRHRPVTVGGNLGLVERMALAMDAPPLRTAGVQALSDLATGADEMQLAPGAVLLDNREPPAQFFLAAEGELEATHGPSKTVCTFRPGDVVAGAAAFGGVAGKWTVVARSNARVLAFRLEDWFDALEEHFDLVRSALGGWTLERERLLELLR
jgi:CRP-like cAMP-binding protein